MKRDIRLLTEHLYTTDRSPRDYQDNPLVCLMWHIFDRASDLSLVLTQGLCVSANNLFFLRVIRVKTSEDQSLYLFLHRETFETGPVHAIAISLLMHSAPCGSLMPHLMTETILTEPKTTTSTPRLEVCWWISCWSGNRTSQNFRVRHLSAPGIHSYVNWILIEFTEVAGVKSELTYHSFRRGGAQHANMYSHLSAQWIFDRGLILTATNKAFSYVFNITSESRRSPASLKIGVQTKTYLQPGYMFSMPVPEHIMQGSNSYV